MSRLGTKKPPIENAYYAPQEHVAIPGKGKAGNAKAGFMNAPYWAKDDYKSSHVDKY